ncbi:MAG: diguanylate cyclase [Chloroflexi bacterium]|nr:diguanylate cyclase [Chloroflexota bacterium]
MDNIPISKPIADLKNQTLVEKVDRLNERAYALYLEDQVQEALKLSEQAYQLASAVGEEQKQYRPGMAASLVVAGFCRGDIGPYDLALKNYFDALDILGQFDNQTLRARAYGGLSWLYLHSGDFSASRSYSDRAISISEANDLQLELCQNLNTSGGILAEFNEFDDAVKNLERSILIAQEIKSPRDEATAYNNLSITLLGLHKLAEAEAAALASLKLIQPLGYKLREAAILDTLGLVYQRQGRLDLSAEYFLQAIDLTKSEHNTLYSVENFLHLGSVLLEAGQLSPQVGQYLHQALEVSQRHDGFRYIYACHEQLANYYERLGDYPKAFEHFRQFHILKEKIFNQDAMRRMLNILSMHKITSAQKDAEILRLNNSLLVQELEQGKQRHVELEYQAATDPLTGLFNRRYFMQAGLALLTSALSNNLPLALIMLDVDFFKKVNDLYGHLIGDKALIQISSVLNSSIRVGDLCCRYGGEEFVILLPNTDLETGQAIAMRIWQQVSNALISISESETFQITISAGVTRLRPDDTGLASLIDRADQALLRAKASGRNRVLSNP